MWRSIVPVTYTVHDTISCSATVCPILLCCDASMSPCPSCIVWFWKKKRLYTRKCYGMLWFIKCILFPNMFSSGDNVLARSSAIVRTSMATCSTVWPHLWPSTRRILGFKDFTCRVAETEGGNWWYGYDPIEGFGWCVTKSAEMQVGERIWVIMTSGIGNPGIYGLTKPRKEDTFGLRI